MIITAAVTADGCMNNIKFRNYSPIRDLFIMTGKRPLTCKRITKRQSHPSGVNRGAGLWGRYVDHCISTTFSTREELYCF